MADDTPPAPKISSPVRQLVASATDEQLAWIVGPDRHFYSREAIFAATRELVRRREEAGETRRPPFQVAAFALGPIWYFYHGLIGRGVLILLVLVAALIGLQPIAEAIGVPATLWVLLVLLGVGAYCGRYGERDRAESVTQARAAARKSVVHRERQRDSAEPAGIRVAVLGCREAGEQAVSLLEREAIAASLVEVEDGGEARPVAVEVAPADHEAARALLRRLLADLERLEHDACTGTRPIRRNSAPSGER